MKNRQNNSPPIDDIYLNKNVSNVVIYGSQLCKKLKTLYPEQSWKEISSLLTYLKSKTCKYYPNVSEEEHLSYILKYSDKDIKEAIDI